MRYDVGELYDIQTLDLGSGGPESTSAQLYLCRATSFRNSKELTEPCKMMSISGSAVENSALISASCGR